jgi:two-component system response regulator YesN
MYKVLLAEDEVEVLSSMLKTIQWKNCGFETPIGCQDGLKAIELLKSGFVPNLVITDICMPFADGLELTEYVSEHLPDTIVVILTGYDEFKYAHTAIKLKVYDYVLKPVTPSRMTELLNRFKQELDERELKNVENSMDIVSSYFLNRLVTKKMDSTTIEKNCRANKLTFQGRYHIVTALDVDLPVPVTIRESNTLELMRYGLFNISQELAQTVNSAVVFQGNDGVTNIIISEQEVGSAYTEATNLAHTISDSVKQSLKISVSAGIGEPVAYLDDLYLSRMQAGVALGYRFFYGDSSIICEADVDIKQSGGIDYNSCEKQLVEAIKAMDRISAIGAVTNLVTQLKKYHIPFDKCVLYSQKLMMRIITLTNEVTGELDAESLEKISESTNFYSASNLTYLQKLLENVCSKVFEILEVVKNNTIVSQVVKAENYIKQNYSDPELSLNAITEHLSISTSYFSAIFKAQTGSTFVEYLTHTRMEKAKQILAFTDRRTYEAAEDVGFSDPHYFSVAFKRVTGMTPKEYREQARKNA